MWVFHDSVLCCSFVTFVYHLCLPILQKKEFPGFIVLHQLEPPVNIRDAVDFYILKCMKFSFKQHLDIGFWKWSVFRLFLYDVEWDILGITVIPISIQRFNLSWKQFIPGSSYTLVIWSIHFNLGILFHKCTSRRVKWYDNFYHQNTD